MNRNMVSCAAAVALLAALAGCRVSGTETHPREPDTPVTPGARGTGPDGTAPDGPGAAPGGGAPAGAGTLARCRADQLRARLGRLDQAAGAASSAVIVTNAGAASCRLRGWPGVSFADADGGLMLGSSERYGGPAPLVVLRPGATAWAGIDWTAPRTPAEAAYAHPPRLLTVIPPDETTRLHVPWPFGTPAARGHLRIQPFHPGTGPS